MLGLAVLPPPAANPRAPLRLLTAADAAGRLLKLRVGAPTVDKSADVGEVGAGWWLVV